MSTENVEPVRRLNRPYFELVGVSEVPESQYHGMRVGLPPICCVCRCGTDGPRKGCAECICFECYELIRGKAAYLRSLGSDMTDTTSGINRTPVIRCFCVPFQQSGDVIAYACDEDGKTLSSHFCSDEHWAAHDIMNESHRGVYSERYPDGYRMEWIGSPPDDWQGHVKHTGD